MNIGYTIVKFPSNDGGVYISTPDNKVAEENKRNMIEGLNNLQTVGGNKNVFSE